MADAVTDIVSLWGRMLPVAGYTGGQTASLTGLFLSTPENLDRARADIAALRDQIGTIADADLRATAAAVLTSLKTQLDLSRPSGAGPSGTGMGGVWAAADGVFYIVLKGDAQADWVGGFLDAALDTVRYETRRWLGQDVSILVRRECIDTANYFRGTLQSLVKERPAAAAQCQAILDALDDYEALFLVPGLDSDDFATYWPIFRRYDAATGPLPARLYPQCLLDYYQITDTAADIETIASGWLELDLPVTLAIAEQVAALPAIGAAGDLQTIWDKVSATYAVDFGAWLERTVDACRAFGMAYVIGATPADEVRFDPTPDYLVNLVTGGEDFAIDYMNPASAFSQLYLTEAKNSSLLTMINILVHEASHGYNFVLSAKHASSPLLNINTALEVPMTEGMAFYREFQYWQAAQALVGRSDLDDVQKNYLALYGETPEAQAQGVLCAQLETYIWRVIRYVRALCDVRVNGGTMTYTDFIAWAADLTGLAEETLHGECFTFMASPGYAPCYAVGGATYAMLQKRGAARGVTMIDFNTYASSQGFYAWPVAQRLLAEHIAGGGG